MGRAATRVAVVPNWAVPVQERCAVAIADYYGNYRYIKILLVTTLGTVHLQLLIEVQINGKPTICLGTSAVRGRKEL